MDRKLLIFGNGLGMALDSEHFALQRALQDVWEEPDYLTPEQKVLIEHCYGHLGAPEGEHELETLYQAVTYCNGLVSIGDTEAEHWLTSDGQSFPEVTSKYFHKVAANLHLYDGELPDAFLSPLIDFIKESKSHVATLNYDKLLYNAFIERDVVTDNYGTTKLVDGMIGRGLSDDSLERKYGNDFGYYLHLHGSPLFYSRGDYYGKYSRGWIEAGNNIPSKHIVLTHFSKKMAVIMASEILFTYWSLLPFATKEAREIILFGYSGLDKHLNRFLKLNAQDKSIRVVEWEGAGDEPTRKHFWKDEFGQEVGLVRLDNVLTFDAW